MSEQDPARTDDDDVARLLRAAGPREQLPDTMKQRWEEQFRRELQPVLKRRDRGRRRWVMGLCASLALLVGTFVLIRTPPGDVAPAIRVSQALGGSRIIAPDMGELALLAGQRVPPGSIINTGENGLVAISYGAHELRLNRHTRLLVYADRLELEAGELYASDHGSTAAGAPLVITTAHGSIRDIGTQFTVTAYPDRTVATVRRGIVLVNTGREELRAEARPGSASRLIIDRDMNARREQVAPTGTDWNWIYQSGTNFTVEGKTAHDFLQWSVGESGLTLVFASKGAEALARTTRLHGDIGGLDPERAVDAVLASTDLVAERSADNTLRISVNRGS